MRGREQARLVRAAQLAEPPSAALARHLVQDRPAGPPQSGRAIAGGGYSDRRGQRGSSLVIIISAYR